jgi:hypothetical protein
MLSYSRSWYILGNLGMAIPDTPQLVPTLPQPRGFERLVEDSGGTGHYSRELAGTGNRPGTAHCPFQVTQLRMA